MKKQAVILMLSAALMLSSCGTNNQGNTSEQMVSTNSEESSTESQESSSATSNLDAIGQIDVDEGLFNVELNIPADFVGEHTQADLDAIAKEYGYKSIVLNPDGSATYVMTKKQHAELMDEYREQINSGLDEMIGSENYPNFTSIEANDNFTEFTITTKSTELDLNESFSVMAFYMYGGLYSVFSGEDIDNVSVTFVNADSGEVIQTANSSDMEQ